MTTFNQQDRLLELITPEGCDELVLTSFKGEEALFHGYKFELDVFSTSQDAESLNIIGRPVTVKIHDTTTGTKVFTGVVVKIEEGSIDYQSHRHYHFEMVPWMYGFKLVEDCRIFQGLTVPQIFTTLCKEVGFTDYDLTQLTRKYEPKNYCVQYNETTYHFIHRLFEEEGIFYYYNHENHKNEHRHYLILADEHTVLPKYSKSVICTNVHHTDKHFNKWHAETSFHSSQLTLGNYSFKRPEEVPLIALIKTKDNAASILGRQKFEQYRYGKYYITNEAGQMIAKREIQAIEWPHHQIYAKGNILDLSPGQRFHVSEHDDETAIGDYFVISIHHEATDKTQLAGLVKNNPEKETPQQTYSNSMTCLPINYNFMPLPLTDKPQIDDIQSAVVVGPQGKQIHADKYGRVKVQFPWDRKGKKDENSSCWMRVMQMIGGDQWGSQWIPRVGDEVLVAFINSDIDRPIIMDGVYNENNREPFPLPENQNISGIKTQITDGQQTFDRGHEVSFDDTPDNEKMKISSEGDLNIDVLNSVFHTVDGGENISVNGDMLMQVLNGKSEIKAKEIHLIVGNSRIDLDANGVSIKPAGQLKLLVKGGGAIKPVARVGDDHQCPKHTAATPHKGGPILKGSNFVKVNGIPVARVGDPMHCRVGTDKIKKGIDSISVGGKSIAKVGLKAEHGGVITAGSPNVVVGEYQGPAVNLPLMKKIQTQTYWVSVSYPKPDLLKLPNNEIHQGVTFDYQDTKKAPLNSGATLDKYAAGSVTLTKPDKMQTIKISDAEIIAVNDKPIDYPLDTVKAKNSDFKGVSGDDKKPARKKGEETPKSIDKILHATTLYPPMIVNLRDEQKDHSKDMLTPEQLRHIKNWGNNITIFIHGFNVPFGYYPKQFSGVDMVNMTTSAGMTPSLSKTPIAKYSAADSDRTLYRNLDMLTKRFSELNEPQMLSLYNKFKIDNVINGLGAHNWFIHMEDNLNRATDQFNRTDYRKFTRCLNVAWSGDVGFLNYLDAEESADRAGARLVPIIEKLTGLGVKVNIISHSLGARVLLKAMDILGGPTKNKTDIIDHVFLCEPAVPQSALSKDASKDNSVKGNCKYINAYKSSKKISVLFSSKDSVLSGAYQLANHVGYAPDSFLTSKGWHEKAAYDTRFDKSFTDEMKAMLSDPKTAAMVSCTNNTEIDQVHLKNLQDLVKKANSKVEERYRPQPALGLVGPDTTGDDFMRKLKNEGKLISGDTSEDGIESHSAMMIPTKKIMDKFYRKWMVNKKQGISKLGILDVQ